MKECKQEILVKLTATWRKKKGKVFIDEEQDMGKPKAIAVMGSSQVNPQFDGMPDSTDPDTGPIE